MNILQAIFVVSLIIGTIGFFGYMYEVLACKVDRYTRWRQLSRLQWFYFLAATQFFIILPLVLLIKRFS